MPPLHYPFNVPRHPPTVEISRLGLNLLPVDVTVPRPRVERQVIPDGLEACGGILIRPDTIRERLVGGIIGRIGDGPVGRRTFPLAVCPPRGFGERDLDGRRW